MHVVPADEARRIAVRAQLLEGTASSVLDTVGRLGYSPSTARRKASSFSAPGADTSRLDEALARLETLLQATP